MHRPILRVVSVTAICGLLALSAHAADDLRESWHHQPEVTVPELPAAPTIDGRVSDREWVGAARLAPLIARTDGRMDPETTEVFIGYTDDALHIAWRVYRAWEGPMNMAHVEPGRHDGRSVWLDDCIEIFLDLENEGRRAVNLAANAAGAFGDGMGRVGSATDFAASWDWDYAARETGFGWEGEVSVSFEELGFDGPPRNDDDVWGFNFWRNNKTPDATVSAFVYQPRWGARLRFDETAPAFRVNEAGSIGDRSMGMLAEVVNLADTAQQVSVDVGIYRRDDEAGELDFIDQVMSGLEEAEQEVGAFTTPQRQIEQLLSSFFETIEQRTERVRIEPGHRAPLNLSVTDTESGDYVIAFRATDDGDDVIASGLIPARQWDPVEIVTVPYFLDVEHLDVTLSLHTQDLRERVERVRVALEQDGESITGRTVDVDAILDGLGMPTHDLGPGPYHVQIKGLADDGEVVAQVRESRYRPEPPFWAVEEHGKAAFVPEPWTPVDAGEDATRIWGRTYEFSESFLPAQMSALDAPLFAAPPRLRMRVDGEDVALQGAIELVESDDERARYAFTGAAGPVDVSASVVVEFDGFTTVELDLDTEEVTVERLFVEFPLAAEHAELYTFNAFFNEQRGSNIEPYSHGLPRAGRISDGFGIGFNHAIWLGTPERGFQWCAETAEHWHNEDRGRAIEVLPDADGGQTLFRLRVIDRPTEAEQLSYRWGLVASPTRPYPDGDHLYYLQTNYTGAWPEEDGKARFGESMAKAQRLSADWMNVFGQWNRDFAFGQPIREGESVADRRKMVEHIHDAGLKTTWYAGWNAMHPNMEMYPFYGEAMRRVPTRFSGGSYKECTYGGYEDYLANGAVWMVESLGVDGIYLDSTPGPEPCYNPYHNCGFVDHDEGHRVVTRDIWGRRDLFKRLYKIFHGEVVDDGVIYGHDGRPALLGITSFVDVNHTGEAATMEDYEDLDFYLAQYNPTQYGIPVEHAWRAHHPVPRNLAWGVALVHDNRIKMYPPYARQSRLQENSYEPDRGIDWRMWVPRKWFQWEDHQWHPYFANQDVLTVSGERLYASFHHNADGQIIFNVVNMTAEAQEGRFELELDALGLPETLYARDVVTHETFEITGGQFSLKVLGHRPRVLMIDREPIPRLGPGVDE